MRNRLAAAVAVVLLCAWPVLAGEIHVMTLADSGAGSLREAIAVAAPGDTIVFDVTGTITLSSGELVIDKDLTLRGPGPDRLAIRGNYNFDLFRVRSGSTTTISGLTIRDGAGSYYGGGAIHNDGGMLTVSDSTFTGNGTGIYTNGGTVTIAKAVFSGNYSAGIFNYGGTVSVTDSVFSGNTGRAIYNYVRATTTVTKSIVSGNSGYGFYNNYYSTLTVTDSTISSNFTVEHGGGIYNEFHAKVTIINSTISGNSGYAGAGIYNYRGEVTLINTTVADNSARICGGGIISGRGGETSSYGGSVVIINSTLSGNSAPTGGALCNVPRGSRTPPMTLQNSILADNPSGGNCSGPLNINSLGYNLSDDNTCAEFFTQSGDRNHTPAGFDPRGLRDNGGPTKTVALLAASPARDAVPLGACTDAAGEPNRTDQRGVARPQGPACDIGAYEFQTPAQTVQTLMGAVRALGLARGIENRLLGRLQAALNALGRGDTVANVAARNQLQIFIYEVMRLEGTALTPEQAAEFIAAAERILESLGGGGTLPERGVRENRGRRR